MAYRKQSRRSGNYRRAGSSRRRVSSRSVSRRSSRRGGAQHTVRIVLEHPSSQNVDLSAALADRFAVGTKKAGPKKALL